MPKSKYIIYQKKENQIYYGKRTKNCMYWKLNISEAKKYHFKEEARKEFNLFPKHITKNWNIKGGVKK